MQQKEIQRSQNYHQRGPKQQGKQKQKYMTIYPLRKLTKLLTLKKNTVDVDEDEGKEEVSEKKKKIDGGLDELRPTEDRHGEDDLKKKIV